MQTPGQIKESDEDADNRIELFTDIYNAIADLPDANERFAKAFVFLRGLAGDQVRSYDHLMEIFMAHWDAAAELAKKISVHPNNPLHKPTKEAPRPKPRRKRTHWPKELAC